MHKKLCHRVLVIEDDSDTCANLRDILELDDYQVEIAGTMREALGPRNWSELSAIILDRRLPDGSAEEALPRLKELAPAAAVLIVTGYADLQGAIAALRQGATDYLLKPINADALRASLARVVQLHDLTRKKERSEAAFRTLVEAAPSMIVILRPDHTVAYFNPFAAELTGYSAEEIQGKDFFPIFLPEAYRELVGGAMARILSGTPKSGVEVPVVCRDGLQRWIIWNADSLQDYEGGTAVLAIGQDITNLKCAQELALRSERLAAIGQMVAGLAHESGNALARSQSCLEMLEWEVADRPDAVEMIKKIQNAQDHLKQLYEEVRSYAAPIKLDRDVWDLRMIWRQAWENLGIVRQGRTASLHDQGTTGLRCAVDQFRLEQVFRNIFENALAACRDPVRIQIQCAETDMEGRPSVRIDVRDYGPGLTAEQQQRIFDPFFTTKTKGTGLGMAIAKRIVEAHGGRIGASTAAGGGADISIILPREEAS